MYERRLQTLVVSTAVAVALALTPAMTVADETPDDDRRDGAPSIQDTDSETAVTLDEMTVDENEANSGETSRATFEQQQEDEGIETPAFVRTVGINALWGGAAGALVGLSFYVLTLAETTPWVIAQFAGGGILVGGLVGVVQAAGEAEAEPETRAAEKPASVDYVEQRAPETLDVLIIDQRF